MDITVIKYLKMGYLKASGKDKLKELYRKANSRRKAEAEQKNSSNYPGDAEKN